MFNLVVTVMAIALAALVVGMGAGSVDSDVGNRRLVEEQAFAGIAAVSASVGSYRIANGGALPRMPSSEGDRAWVEDLGPYLPFGSLPVVNGHGWRYLAGADGGRRICLAADDGASAPESTREAFAALVRRSSAARSAVDCDAVRGAGPGDVLIVDIGN